jgi:hypothetical protein
VTVATTTSHVSVAGLGARGHELRPLLRAVAVPMSTPLPVAERGTGSAGSTRSDTGRGAHPTTKLPLTLLLLLSWAAVPVPHVSAILCSAGTFCSRYSASSTYGCVTCSTCGRGQYSEVANIRSACNPCAAGLYGSTTRLTTASCTGPCNAGYFGSSTGMTSSLCSGQCTAGFICAAGSTMPNPVACGVGLFSLAGASVCTPCPAGRYGSAGAQQTSSCSGLCRTGYFCVAGSTSPTQSICPAGKYSPPGAASCLSCPTCLSPGSGVAAPITCPEGR